MKHRIFMCSILIATLVLMLSITAGAEELVAQGNMDENIEWSFYDDGTLTIIGEGVINQNYTYEQTPWFDIEEQVKQIIFGEGIIEINPEFFSQYSNVEFYQVDPNNPSYWSDSYGVLFSKDRSILHQAPIKLAGEYVIPDGVLKIEGGSFLDCNLLTSIEMPDSVTELGDWAFA